MTEGQNYQIEKELAKSVQKTLLAHQVDGEKIQDTMRFLGVVLGGMIGSLYGQSDHDTRVTETLESIKKGIEKGLPE
ncbi:MAG: hypothetical protein PF495_18645 [Spirochaetales bacterium]|jgi:hypothetical protein|nr:hypothetical protein [Spirochaetales bacterium]